jgi:hypothetical protein
VSGFVQLLGGSLRFEDTPGGGLTVVIELPNAIEVRSEPVDSSLPAEGLSAPVGE